MAKNPFQTDLSTTARVGQPTPAPMQEYSGWLKAVEGTTKSLETLVGKVAAAKTDTSSKDTGVNKEVYQEVAATWEQPLSPEENAQIEQLVQSQGQLKGNATQIILANRVRGNLGETYYMYEIDKALEKYQSLNKEHYGEGFTREDDLQKQQEDLNKQVVSGAISNGSAVYNADGSVNQEATLFDQKQAKDAVYTMEALYNDAVFQATKGRSSMRDYSKLGDSEKAIVDAQVVQNTLEAVHNTNKLAWNRLYNGVKNWNAEEWNETVAVLNQSIAALKTNTYAANAPQSAKDQIIKVLDLQAALIDSLKKVNGAAAAKEQLEYNKIILEKYGLEMKGPIGDSIRASQMGVSPDITTMAFGSKVVQQVSSDDFSIPSPENIDRSVMNAVLDGTPASGMNEEEQIQSLQNIEKINKYANSQEDRKAYQVARTNTTKSLFSSYSQAVNPAYPMKNKTKAAIMNSAIETGNNPKMLDSAKEDLPQKEYTKAMNDISFIAEDAFIKENTSFMSGMNEGLNMFVYNPETRQFERGEDDRASYNPVSWFAESGYSDTLTEMNKTFNALVETQARAMGIDPKKYNPLPLARDLQIKTKGGFSILGDVGNALEKEQQRLQEERNKPTATELAQAFWDETVDAAKKARKSWGEAKDALKAAWEAEMKQAEENMKKRAEKNPEGIDAWILSGAQ